MCRNCGEVIECPHCDVSLTYHASTNMLKCHHCGWKLQIALKGRGMNPYINCTPAWLILYTPRTNPSNTAFILL